jgi:putative intracellular protease/amidase
VEKSAPPAKSAAAANLPSACRWICPTKDAEGEIPTCLARAVGNSKGPSAFDVKLVADYAFADCPPLDILCVPGGWGTRRETYNPMLLAWLRSRAPQVELLTAVCTGSMLLGFAGLLEVRRATTRNFNTMTRLLELSGGER